MHSVKDDDTATVTREIFYKSASFIGICLNASRPTFLHSVPKGLKYLFNHRHKLLYFEN